MRSNLPHKLPYTQMTYQELNTLALWQQMPTITLDEMSAIKLMNRIDTKFVLDDERCLELLQRAVGEYSVQIIDDIRACRYETLYYDTADYDMYRCHHNQQLTRQKIRTRTYVESKITFIEVKNKTNKGRTKKKRIRLPEEYFARVADHAPAAEFLTERANYAPEEVMPALKTSFDRITLVNKARTERLTIDMNLRFENVRGKKGEVGLDGLVIVELKQDGMCHSPMKDILLDLRVKPMKVSKYMLGTVLSDAEVKRNRYKAKVRLIEKAINQ